MNSESGSEQRNSSLDALKQRQKSLTNNANLDKPAGQHPLHHAASDRGAPGAGPAEHPGTPGEHPSEIDSLATKKSLEPLATADLLARWLNQTKDLHQGMCQDLEKVQRGIQEENRQAGKQRDEFMRQLSTVIERLREMGKN